MKYSLEAVIFHNVGKKFSFGETMPAHKIESNAYKISYSPKKEISSPKKNPIGDEGAQTFNWFNSDSPKK